VLVRGPAVLLQRFIAHQGFVLAGALSYSFLLCVAPLALLLFSAAGFILQSDQLADYVVDSGTRLFPGYGHEVLQTLAVLTRERRVTGILGAAGLMMFASQLFSLLRTVANTAFEVPQRRGLVHGFAVDLLAVGTLALLSVVLSVALLVALAVGELSRRLMPSLVIPGGIQLVAAGFMYVVLLILLFLVYRTAPNVRVPASAAIVATVLVACFWEAARWSLTVYLARFGTYGKLYGSLGVVVASLVWIYYSAVIFVLGAEVAALVAGRPQTLEAGTARETAPGVAAPHRARLPMMGLGALVVTAAAVFAAQNREPTTIHLLSWSIEGLPLAALVVGPAAISGLAIGLAMMTARARLRRRIQELEERLRARAEEA
jgi:membrane protein